MSDNEPVAWRAYDTDGSEAVYSLYEQARAAADEMNWSVEPLYRSPTLTDAEREAIAWFAEAGKPLARLTQSHNLEQYRATLRTLLERTK